MIDAAKSANNTNTVPRMLFVLLAIFLPHC
jgi:hypothetical protein